MVVIKIDYFTIYAQEIDKKVILITSNSFLFNPSGKFHNLPTSQKEAEIEIKLW